MAGQPNGKRPGNLKKTIRSFGEYLGHYKRMLLVVAVLATISAGANLLGTYMIKPIVNQITVDGSIAGLTRGVVTAAVIYIIGALSTLGYTQTMVRAAQKILREIRHNLFAHLQT